MMAPETTYAVTIGEVSRRLDDINKGQAAIIARMDTQAATYVTRVEWDLLRADIATRRVPWTSVAALVVSGVVSGAALFASLIGG